MQNVLAFRCPIPRSPKRRSRVKRSYVALPSQQLRQLGDVQSQCAGLITESVRREGPRSTRRRKWRGGFLLSRSAFPNCTAPSRSARRGMLCQIQRLGNEGRRSVMPLWVFQRRRDIELEVGATLAGQLIFDAPDNKRLSRKARREAGGSYPNADGVGSPRPAT
jgi:hypothetical protein